MTNDRVPGILPTTIKVSEDVEGAVPVEQPKYTSEELSAWVPLKKVMLATPTNRGLMPEWVASLLNTMGSPRVISDGVQIVPFIWPGESLISRARNDIVRHFLESECDFLFFIDDDIAWEPESLFDILATGKDVIGGLYPIKTLRWDRLIGVTVEEIEQAKLLTTEAVINGADPNHPLNEGPLVVAQDLGTGFLCISRQAIESLAVAFPDLWYMSNARQEQPKKTLDLFGLMYDGEGDNRILLSEDYAFCRRWQSIGGTVFVHTGIPVLTHVGKYWYGKFD